MYVFNIILFTLLLYYIYKIYKNKEITTEQLTSILLSISPLFTNIYEILYYIPELVQYIGGYQYYDSFITELLQYNTVVDKEVQFTQSDIIVSNVSFSYNENIVYDKINIIIPHGSFCTLRGKSGSGKSTFLKLLGAILKPTEGTITIDNHSIHDVSLLSLYQHMLYLQQHPTLFDNTIYYNINYGLDINKEDLVSLLKQYQIETYLPDIDSQVGKGGSKLSGGQKQLIYIIRCMFSPANIFLLDESMSAMDYVLTKCVINMLTDLHKKNKTILLISHNDTLFTPNIIEFNNGIPTFFTPL
jgi:ABC-type bacteriocin/lantibiotic exporter with double-glycine peptidase domain